MKILVSACLMGQNCKYNGGNNYSKKIEEIGRRHEIITVCPEVMGGLPTPRRSCEIVNGEVINIDGESKDREFRLGAERCLEIARMNQIDLAILQSRSPSCGVNQIYDGTFTKTLIPGSGVFASLLKENGFKVVDLEELDKEQL